MTKNMEMVNSLSIRDGNIRHSRKSLVEIFNLTSLVKDLRLKGRSYKDIADYINKEGLIPNGYSISYVSIARWCKNNDLAGDVSEFTGEEAINVYLQECKALNLINDAIDLVSVQMDEMNKQIGNNNPQSIKDVRYLVECLDKLTQRQQTICNNVAAFQEKIYKYENVSRVIAQVMSKISTLVSPEDYYEIKQEISKDTILREAIHSIASST